MVTDIIYIMSTESTEETKQPSIQEVVQRLENEYREAIGKLGSARDAFVKAQDTVISTQDAAMKSFQNLTAAKEHYLHLLLKQQQEKLAEYENAQAPAQTPRQASRSLATVRELSPEEARSNNLA